MKKPIVALGLSLLAGACAQDPKSIAPSYVSTHNYRGLGCGQMRDELVRIDSALVTASKQQSDARTGDVVGILLLGLPVSTLSGSNIAPQVASLKGQKETLEMRLIRSGCRN